MHVNPSVSKIKSIQSSAIDFERAYATLIHSSQGAIVNREIRWRSQEQTATNVSTYNIYIALNVPKQTQQECGNFFQYPSLNSSSNCSPDSCTRTSQTSRANQEAISKVFHLTLRIHTLAYHIEKHHAMHLSRRDLCGIKLSNRTRTVIESKGVVGYPNNSQS
jgi:hypothetical protein